MGKKGQLYIGTSGWSYPHWQGIFYPLDLPAVDYLGYYARYFQTVEINNTFYQLPREAAVRQWLARVPGNFIFAIKASRFITHRKKLKGAEAVRAFQQFYSPVQLLKDQLGPLLFQLPPHWRVNPERLRAFLEALPRGLKVVFEFRDPSWFDEAVYQILREHQAACCWYHLEDFYSPQPVLAPWVYIRLHGAQGKYLGKYSTPSLKKWAREIKTCCDQGLEVYCYFNNDPQGHAVANALTLKELTGGDN